MRGVLLTLGGLALLMLSSYLQSDLWIQVIAVIVVFAGLGDVQATRK
ncbi:MAG: hypothetical protein GX030_00360 [Firmicutes bacterium]|nr:hypothetical protein [Bacillota bacterium]